MPETHPGMERLVSDLEAETRAVGGLVTGLSPIEWDTVTPSEPWTVCDQIGHLAYFDEQAELSARDPDRFAARVNEDAAALGGDLAALHRMRHLDGRATLMWWREARRAMLDAFRPVDPDHRLPWYGPPMRARSAVVARLMETWAHGTDIADALGGALPVTDRLFHVADLGVRTFSWSFANRGLEIPQERVRVALRGPSGTTRVWNDGSDSCVTGPLEEFCLVVAQRRNVSDTHLALEGAVAHRWMEIAQVFAGPPGPGR